MFQGNCDLRAAVKRFEGSVMEFAGVVKGGVMISHGVAGICWKPPEQRRMAVNVDDSVGGGLSAWALIARDHLGKLIFVASGWGKDQSPQLAESKALAWAASLAVKHGWTLLIK